MKLNNFKKDLIYSGLGKFSYTFLTLIFTIVCTRLYGAEVFGEFTFNLTLINLLVVLVKVGFDNGLLYFVPKEGNKFNSFSFITVLLLAIACILLINIFSNDNILKISSLLIIGFALESLFFSLYTINGEIKSYYKINGFYSMLLRIILVIVFYKYFEVNTTSIILAVFISLILSNLIYLIRFKSTFETIKIEKYFFNYSIPLLFASLMGSLLTKIDILILGVYRTDYEVGIYQTAILVSGVLSVILPIIINVYAPKVSILAAENKLQEIGKLHKKISKYLLLLAFIILVGVISLDRYILSIFGPEYLAAERALTFLMIGQFFNIAVGAVWTTMAMLGYPRYQFYVNIIILILNVILNLIFIPKFGIEGAAITTMISVIITNLSGHFFVKLKLKL